MSTSVSLKSKKVAVFVTVALATTFVAGTASAAGFVVGRLESGNSPVLFKKDNSGKCSKSAIPVVSGQYQADGSIFSDVMYVHDEGATFTWCGYTIRDLAALSHDLVIRGREGDDYIWGGNGGGAAAVFIINGDALTGASGNDTIWAGPADWVTGSGGNDTILLPPLNPLYGAEGGPGDDVICTRVDGVFSTFGIPELDGGTGNDKRYGPSALSEFSFETTGTSSEHCDNAYLAVALNVLAMLDES